jgi:hypothetical protein
MAKLSDYEAICVDGEWKMAWYRPGLPVTHLSKKDGLPHPLKGRRVKKKAEQNEIIEDGRLTAAQNLMLRSSAEPYGGGAV